MEWRTCRAGSEAGMQSVLKNRALRDGFLKEDKRCEQGTAGPVPAGKAAAAV